MREEKLKICFVLPEKIEDTATHFRHKWELLQELKEEVQFAVCAGAGFDLWKIFFARFQGVRTYYVHYSFKGAIIAWFATKLFGGQVFYWNCGMPWLYKRGLLEEYLFLFILHHTILVTATDGLAHEYQKHYKLDKKNIRVVPNYIRVSYMQGISRHEARNRLGLPKDKKIVLFLHRLSRRKGAHLLPNIIKEFKDISDVLFLIVGDGPEKNTLRLQIENYNLQVCVRFEGSVPQSKVSDYMKAADIYLMPSEEEGMPNTLLEAMAAGVPFVVSQVASVSEITPPSTIEFVLPSGETNLFVEKIKKLLSDEDLRDRISKEEQAWVRRYDVSVIAPRYLELFRE